VLLFIDLGLINDAELAPEEIEGQRQHSWSMANHEPQLEPVTA